MRDLAKSPHVVVAPSLRAPTAPSEQCRPHMKCAGCGTSTYDFVLRDAWHAIRTSQLSLR
eukprot:3356428-Prymnesium_polylepis.1